MTKWSIAAVTAAIVIGTASAGAAQPYPSRVIKAIVPYTAGGPTDVITRIITKRLSEVLGCPIIIENRPGASGMIANRAVAAAEPDGYTLLFGNTSTFVVFPAVSHARDFDVLRRLAPVARLLQGYEVMVVDPAGPAKTLPAFIAYAKAHPGALNYGSVGFGNLTHVAGELLKLRAGIDLQHVPYKGAPEVIAGLLSGQVQMNFTEVSGVVPLAREGKIRPLAIASETRDPKAPDIPTFAEEGVPDFIVATFTGVMAPAGTPPAIVAKLNGAINAVLAQADTRTMLENLGSSVRPSTVEEFAAFLVAEQRKWEEVAPLAATNAE
ncbi:MAG TPA: tripartite tricarboxylate transporter substrate binding protein [Xanthobacteraceae bacterium]|jgi:tripartite-type tricarboxylate transporter receptor subunit TctC|nr:tripartite tricarboxylate transporter substrate binding protein [Xanthobacteraceae bacterium]